MFNFYVITSCCFVENFSIPLSIQYGLVKLKALAVQHAKELPETLSTIIKECEKNTRAQDIIWMDFQKEKPTP